MAEDDVIAVEVADEALILALRGSEFDRDASGQFRSAALAAVTEHTGLPVIVDLGGLGLLPSLSIGVLITLSQVVRDGGHRMLVAGLSPTVRQTLTICRLDRVFELHDTREEALASVGQ